MKKLFIIASLMVACFACTEEVDITPSNCERDWTKEIDLSNSTIRKAWEDCGIAIFTNNINEDLDIRYQSSYTLGQEWQLTYFKDKETEQKAIDFFYNSILKYFTNKDFLKKEFPRRIFLFNEIYLDGGDYTVPYLYMSDYIGASLWRWGVRTSIHSKPLEQGVAYSCNFDIIDSEESVGYLGESQYNTYVKDNMFIMICRLWELCDFTSRVDQAFYPADYNDYMITSAYVGDVWTGRGNKPCKYLDPADFLNLGLPYMHTAVGCKLINNANTEYQDKVQISTDDDKISGYGYWRIPRKQEMHYAFVNAFIGYTDKDWEFVKQAPYILSRFEALVKLWDEIGWDFRSYNPAAGRAFPKK